MVPLHRCAFLRCLIALGLLSWLAIVARSAEVELNASWAMDNQHWFVRIQPALPGIVIASNSPAFADRWFRVTDAATGQPVPFKLRHSRERMLHSIDLSFPQLQRPINLSLDLRGLLLVDERGRRVAYSPQVNLRAPPAAAGERRYEYSGDYPRAPDTTSPVPFNAPPVNPAPTVVERVSSEEPVGGGAPPPNGTPPNMAFGQGAPPPEPINVGAEGPDETQIPQFPFPPPLASAFDEIPRELLVDRKTHPKLKDVDVALSSAFAKCGYGEKSFKAVPDGFALASRLEQINADGSFGANRWSLETAPIRSFSITSYLSALFRARAGHFRVVVFVVTNHPFNQTDAKVSSDQATSWVKKGLNQLPKKIGDRDYTDDYTCMALIYEFETLGGGQSRFVEPSEITGRTHLEKSGLMAALARAR